MRTLTIGDLHGSLRALKQVLERCNYNPKKDKLIFLGDYVDGWSESAELIEYLINLEGDNIFLRGNHDVWCQEWLNTGHNPIIWSEQGGRVTLESYVRTGYLVEQSHKDFFNKLDNWYIDNENRLFIHAGWDYLLGDFVMGATAKVNAGIGAMKCHWDRSLFNGAASAFYNFSKNKTDFSYKDPKTIEGKKFKALEQFKEIYIGHTAQQIGKPMWLGNLCNVDSGCGWSGVLSAIDVDTKEYFTSDLSKELYPEEKGR